MKLRRSRLVRYVWRITFIRAAGAFALLLGMYVLIDTVESASSAQASLARVALSYPFKIPLVAAHVAPVAAALSVVLALGVLKRRGEWDASAAAGISPRVLIGGLFAIPCVLAAAALPLVHEVAPRALSRFEKGTAFSAVRGAKADKWIRDGRRMAMVKEASADATVAIAIDRDDAGRALVWRGPCGSLAHRCVWTRDSGWANPGGAPADIDLAIDVAFEPAPTVYGFVGASLSSFELRALARNLEAQGQTAFALRAELALRTAVALGCALVPALALLLAVLFGTARDARLVIIAIASAAAYWLALSLAWNGALRGVISSHWVDVGVPTGFAAAIAVIPVVRRAATALLRT